MRKFLSSTAGASFNQEIATQTLCVRKDLPKEYDTTIKIITNRIQDFLMFYKDLDKAITAGNLESSHEIQEKLKEKTKKLVELNPVINKLWTKAKEEIDKLRIKDISSDYKTD